MVPLSHVVAFGVAALILIVIPGPNVMFTVGRALALGRRAAVLSVVGTGMGTTVCLVGASLGLGALLMAWAMLFLAVKIAGAVYLIFLGAMAIRERRKLSEALRGPLPDGTARRVVRQGFLVGVTNPKTVVFFAAVLPQFAVPSAGWLPVQFLIIGACFPVLQVLSDAVWAVGAASAREWFARSPKRVEAVGATGGVMIIGVGTTMAFSGNS
ncbi:LysE family translocator [Nocardia sp. CDC160]|uniref:LysE family translocator n=1 Tax=Nocardia sp. CDC160 TaxID=3112166 RepID=UPI002DB61FC3|nr:LysE family translocator [Nocardia sp. CDC160]MEC3914930.1 LysE family translocator [Nocardia sp. CDC160]